MTATLTGGTVEKRTARLTLLIDPRKKAMFEQLCAREDVTPSQKVRQFIRDYVQQQLGDDWMDDAEAALRTKEGDD
ncbi:CopG family transcriptional regulator [Alcanivorax marinus]|uniref:CopG family transcriptional regulator n=1 Tax=Alloalcanivorax marinus TaxID=1177169 RepID=A0A9Q3ULU0_9GAMM|nr:CopG family transcriptional regulator [Alloalcanivorax marinus]MCU5785487.1 helix-turn-helix protein, CopG [Alloalcanivorax marinus]